MITSTSSSDRASRPEIVSPPSKPVARTAQVRTDRISIDSASFLASELLRQPEIRPEVVARARALLSDPSYPSSSVIRSIAQQILAAPDLSSDES